MDFLAQLLAGEAGNNLPLSARTDGYDNALVVKSGAGKLFGFSVYNSSASSQWIQIFDVAKIPAEGARPDAIFVVATATNLGVFYGLPGRSFNAGCVIVNSSTGPTKTIGSKDCFIDAQYI